MFFPRAAVLHRLLQHGFLPWGASPSGADSHGATSPAGKPAPVQVPLSMGPLVLQKACSSVGFPWDPSLLWASTCSGTGSCMSCRGISVLAPAAPPPPPLTLGSAKLFLSYIFTLLFQLQLLLCNFFFLKYVTREGLPLLLMGSALTSTANCPWLC